MMRKTIVAVGLISAALIGSALAQPATNGPSGSGPETGFPYGLRGSAENPYQNYYGRPYWNYYGGTPYAAMSPASPANAMKMKRTKTKHYNYR
jgi:hypothetical protein